MKQGIMLNHGLIRILTLIILWYLSSFAFATNIDEIEKQTITLTKFSSSIKPNNESSDKLEYEYLLVAKSRYASLLSHVNHPNKIFKFLLSNKITNKLPKSFHPYLEQEITNLKGTLEIRAIDSKAGEEIIQYLLHSHGKVYRLHFIDDIPEGMMTDALVSVKHGFHINSHTGIDDLILSAQDFVVLKEAAIPSAFGPQRTIVFLVNFQNKPTDRPWTVEQMKTLFFNNINQMFFESSFRQTTVVGIVVGWYVLSVNSTTSCNTLTDSVARLAEQTARNSGIDLSQYPRRVFVFPRTSSCGWAGLGNVGGTITRSWINGAASTVRTPAHELGHNLGLYHARFLRCQGSPNQGTCSRSEYGDGTDIMGGAPSGFFNAFQKDRLGWLNYRNSPPITTVTTSGTYSIAPYETIDNRPKALRVLQASGSSRYYYLEYRQPISFDSVLACSGCDFTRGVVFHQGNTSSGNTSDLLDMSYNDNNSNRVALLPGQSFRDARVPNGGVTFTVQSVSASGASVRVKFGGGLAENCIHRPPSLTFNEKATRWLNVAERTNYIVNIKNNDTQSCFPVDYIFSVKQPNNALRSELSTNGLRLAPGKTKSFNLSIVALPSAIADIYSFELNAQHTKSDKSSTNIVANVGIQTLN